LVPTFTRWLKVWLLHVTVGPRRDVGQGERGGVESEGVADDEGGRLGFDFLAGPGVVLVVAVEDGVGKFVNERRELLVGQGVGEDDDGLGRAVEPAVRARRVFVSTSAHLDGLDVRAGSQRGVPQLLDGVGERLGFGEVTRHHGRLERSAVGLLEGEEGKDAEADELLVGLIGRLRGSRAFREPRLEDVERLLALADAPAERTPRLEGGGVMNLRALRDEEQRCGWSARR
jgi:hypothetical protein